MRFALVMLASLATTGALAQGFAVRDLTRVAPAAKNALGEGYVDRAEPQRVTLMCTGCAGHPMIDILLGRQTDGTEERVRSGETPISRLEELCRARNPECRITGLQVAPAVGWISSYQATRNMAGSTAIVLYGGDMLTIRSLADDAATASANAEKLVGAIAPQVTGASKTPR